MRRILPAAVGVAIAGVAFWSAGTSGALGAGASPAVVKPEAKPAAAKPEPKPTTAKAERKPVAEAPAGPFLGEYEGTFTSGGAATAKAVAKVFGVPGGAYKVVLILPPAKEGDKEKRLDLTGKPEGEDKLVISGKADGADWGGTLQKQQIVVEGKGATGGKFDGKSSVRKSPTEGKKPTAGAVVLLPFEEGKGTNLDAWTNKKWKLLPDGSIEAGGGDNRTVKSFGDAELHVEFLIPYVPSAGPGRGNSGVYVHDRYEIQVLDSFGLAPSKGGCGAVYTMVAPNVDVSLPPLRWQTYDITFHPPRLDESGKVVKKAVVTVLFNGATVHQNVEVPHPTGSAGKMPEVKTAPLRLQDHGSPARFRNIWLVELKGE